MISVHTIQAAGTAPMSNATTTLSRDERVQRQRVRRRLHPQLLRWLLIGGGVFAVAVASLAYWLNGGTWVDTDDAYVQANTLTLSTDVSGIVSEIDVREGQSVHKGEVLFRLDPQKFQYALDAARANLAQTRLNIDGMKADYQSALRQAAARQQQVEADQATYERLEALVKQHAVTQQETDDARYKLAADQQSLGATSQQARAQLARLSGKPEIPTDEMPAHKQAQAQLNEAQRELDHSIVRAPYDGIVTQVAKLQIGMYLTAGTPAFGLVSDQDIWVEAQPKETQLTWAKPGDQVDVSFDLYPGRTWHGTVQSIAPATDQQFSLLPAENSSGNWVKVVQRLPVRVHLDPQPDAPPLRAGMSAEIDIDTGHVRHLSDLF
jgi:membrane fusion protein (multidrug efflux system)